MTEGRQKVKSARAPVREIAPAQSVPVHLEIEENEHLTTEWLRDLLAKARAAAGRKEAA